MSSSTPRRMGRDFSSEAHESTFSPRGRQAMLLGPLLAVLFAAAAAWYVPLNATHDLDYDEGVNLVKAELLRAGYSLYAEIWSDQPPLFTAFLARWFDLIGSSVAGARALVLLLSAATLWALFYLIRWQTATLPALAAIILLALSEEYLRLSVSVIIGLPALAFAVFSLLLIVAAKERNGTVLLVVAAVLMAAATQIKLMAATAVPAVFIYWLWALPLRHPNSPLRRRLLQLLAGAASFTLTLLLISAWFGALDASQLLRPHLSAATRAAFASAENVHYLRHTFLRHGLAVVFALAGLCDRDNWRSRQLVLPLTWLVTSTLLLLYHRPLWHHHVTLITIPLIWLSAFGMNAARWLATRAFPSSQFYARASTVALVVVGALVLGLYPRRIDRLVAEETRRALPTYDATSVMRMMDAAAAQPGMVLTDRPYYAFQAGLLVPPPVAALTRKRLSSGELTEMELIDVIRTYRPQQILVERFVATLSAGVVPEIEDDYQPISVHEGGLHYVLNGAPEETSTAN